MALVDSTFSWGKAPPVREVGLFAVLMILALLGMESLLWEPQRAIERRDQRDITKLKVEEKDWTKKIKRIQEAQKEVAPKKEQKTIVRNVSKDDPRFAPFLSGDDLPDGHVVARQAMAELTSQRILRGVELQKFSMGEIADVGSYQKLPIDLRLRGPYGATVRYLRTIEELPMLLLYDNIDVAVDGAEPEKLVTFVHAKLYIVKSAAAIRAEQKALEDEGSDGQ